MLLPASLFQAVAWTGGNAKCATIAKKTQEPLESFDFSFQTAQVHTDVTPCSRNARALRLYFVQKEIWLHQLELPCKDPGDDGIGCNVDLL